MTKNYLYSASDKALFDALNQSKITSNELRELFLTRGVLTSKETDREVLAKNFSKYIHDYYDHQRIAAALGVNARREKITSTFISNKLNKSLIENAAEKLKDKIILENNLCHTFQKDDSTFVIEVTYEMIDYNKSEFKQVIQKTSRIEIQRSDSGITVRRPDNEYVKGYEESLYSLIEDQQTDLILNREQINLVNVESESLRTSFFTKLVNLPGFKLKDVSDVYVYKPKVDASFLDGEKDPEEGVHITKVSLKGEGVLVSPELDSLYERSFYIWKIRWRVEEDLVDPDLFDFEAQFSDPENCTGFSFISRGALRYRGNGIYNKTVSDLTDKEEIKFISLIEQTAKSIISDINTELQGDDDESQN
ncbi:hypothetical protein [Shewanella algae]|uniref:hypothetical protein n=1 Tax=Shewanella algae TaxID=38313 RepID=UPI001C570177|nr:hypothetical protein [Shewanella algae]